MQDLTTSIGSIFSSLSSDDPLWVFSPGRINLIGEHTDYNDGFVFPAAIDKGIVGAFSKSQGNSDVVAHDLNERFEFSTTEVDKQGQGNWKNFIIGVVREIMKTGRNVPNFKMVFGGNIPEGAGLSSSAALENCVAFGLNELFQLGLSKQELIFISQKAEHNFVGVKCGIMDQFASMFGQKDKALLLDCRSMDYQIYGLPMPDEELLLINTNVKHSLADSAYNKRREVCERIAGMLGLKALRDARIDDLENIRHQLDLKDYNMASYVIEEIGRVHHAASYLEKEDLTGFGRLMYASHVGLSKKYLVSCEELDFLVDLALRSGEILGARMMGGGFGGCTINLIRKSARDSFIEKAASGYREKFNKSCSFYKVRLGDGTRVLNPASFGLMSG